MNPAALPVVPISLSLLARYVKEKRRKKKGKRNQRNQQLFTFHSKSFILNNIYLLHTCVSVCVCVSQTWQQVGDSLVVHVHSIKKCIFVVVVYGSLFVVVCCPLPEKPNLMDTTCLLVDASYAVKLRILTLPPRKRGKNRKEKRKKRPPFPCSVRIYSRRISMRLHSARNGSDSGH